MKQFLRSALILVLAICAGLVLRHWVATPVRIAGISMADTLLSGDIVLVTRWDSLTGALPERGSVIECTFPDRDGSYVKRLIGLPGESVEFSDGILIVDGRPLSEPYTSSRTDNFRAVLDTDEYLVLGDNRAESYDSRASDMGFISSSGFTGRVRWILWPLNRFGPVE